MCKLFLEKPLNRLQTATIPAKPREYYSRGQGDGEQGAALKGLPSLRFSAAASLLCGLLLARLVNAEPLRFALVAKRIDQSFYVLAGEGCAEAAQAEDDTCLLLGPLGTQHFREQNEVLSQTLARDDLDGIGLAVTHSEWLARHALQDAVRPPRSLIRIFLGGQTAPAKTSASLPSQPRSGGSFRRWGSSDRLGSMASDRAVRHRKPTS